MTWEPDTESYRQFKTRRVEWLEWLRGKDRHSIENQISEMIWDSAVYRIIYECRRYAERIDDTHIAHNPFIEILIDKMFFLNQATAIRRLLDTETRTGCREVYSLVRLIADMTSHAELFTRQNMLAAEGREYDYLPLRRQWEARVCVQADVAAAMAVFPDEPWLASQQRHESLDKIMGIDEAKRTPDDSVPKALLDRTKDALSKANRDIITVVNKFVAHAASPASRAAVGADEQRIMLGHLWASQEAICKVATFISVFLLGSSGFGFLGTPSDTYFQYLDRPAISSENMPHLHEAWTAYAAEVQSWCLPRGNEFT